MTWVFVDDHANEDDQFCAAGGAAAWYHICAHALCRRQEPRRKAAGQALDVVPEATAYGLFAPYTRAQAGAAVKALLRVGLWVEVANGFRLVDYATRYGQQSASPAAPAALVQPAPARASQLGGLARSSQASRGPAGRFQPAQAGVQPASSQPAPAAPASRSSDPVPDPEPIIQKAAAKDLSGGAREPAPEPAAASSDGVTRPAPLPSNLEQALELPICARAKVIQDHPERAEWLTPQRWPEVLKVATELHTACGMGEVRLGSYSRDSGVRAVVELFAAGYMPGDLARAARTLPSDAWWSKEGAKRGLASLSLEVVRRVLATGLTPAQTSRVARALGERPPSALGDLLPKAVGGEP